MDSSVSGLGQNSRGLLIISSLLCLILPAMTFGQQGSGSDSSRAGYELDGQVRYRYEVDGRRELEDDRDSYMDRHYLRTRGQIRFYPLPDVEGVVQIQDSRAFGSEDGAAGQGTLDGNADMLDLHQGYFRVRDVFGSGVDVQVGRQEMAYGNERLIGSVGWSNVGRSFDAIRLRTDGSWGAADVFASRLQNSGSRSQNLFGGWGTLKLSDDHTADVFALLDNNTALVSAQPDEDMTALTRYTLGTYVRGRISSFEYSGEFAWQGGTAAVGDSLGTENSIGGLLIAATGGLDLDPVKITAIYTLLSGDDDPTDGTESTFNTLFATNHKFYGYMDYFPGTFRQAGLQDIALSVLWKISGKASVEIDGHIFETAVGQEQGQSLGKELDATFKYRYNPVVAFTGGLSVFLTDRPMEDLLGRKTPLWGYLMTTVSL